MLPILSCVMVLDGLNAVLSGVLRGAGRQRLGATINAFCCALALPTAWALGFKAKLGVHGFWCGVIAGAALQLLCVLAILLPTSLKAVQEQRYKGEHCNLSSTASPGKDGVMMSVEHQTGQQLKVQPGQQQQEHWFVWDWQMEARRMHGAALAPAMGH